MKVKFNMDSAANIHSGKDSGWFDPVEKFGMAEGEWQRLTDDEKYAMAEEWAWNSGLHIGHEEQP